MKNKFKVIIMLFTLMCMCFSIGFGCSNNAEVEPIKITGFEEDVITKEITVNAGEIVSIQSPLVVDENGNVMDIHVSVSDSNGGYVEVKANKFFALDGGGYTIKYLVQTYDKNTYERYTNVKVVGNFYLGVDMDQTSFLGDKVTIKPVHRLENPTISYTVSYDADGSSVTVTDGTFVTDKPGFYTLNITANDAGFEYKYETKIFAHNYTADTVYGAIEVFDEDWEITRKLDGYGFQNWTLTNTAETGLLGPKGTSDYFLTAKTLSGWQGGLDFWINPLFSKECYEELVKEGFEEIVIPVYQKGGDSNASAYSFTAGHVQNNTSYMYQKHICGVPQNQWVEVRIPLVDGVNDWQRSFLSCYDIYATQSAQILRLSSFSGTCTFYLGSIYAVKDTKIESVAKENLPTQYTVGDTEADLSAYVAVNEDNVDLEYRVLFRGEEEVIQAQGEVKPSYKFTANGDYTISVVPQRKDYNGGFSFNVSVSDNAVLKMSETSDVEYPRDPSGVRPISFEDIGMQLYENAEATDALTDVRYEVYYNGFKIDSADNDFIAEKDGKYTIVAIGRYGTESEYETYQECVVNVFSTSNLGFIDKQNVDTINLASEINRIMEYSPVKEFNSYKVFKIVGPNEIEVQTDAITGDVLNVDALLDGYYKIYATDTNGVDEVVYVDIWDSNVGHIFATVDQAYIDYTHAFKIYSWGEKDYQKIDNVKVSDDGTKYVVTFDSRGNSLDNAFKVYPLHSKAYYEQFEGLDGTISFSFSVQADQNTVSYRPFATSGRPDINIGTEMNISLKLDLMLEMWDEYNSGVATGNYAFLVKELGWVWMDKSTATTILYVGDFTFTYVEEAEIEDKNVNLVDVTSLTDNTFDLSTIINQEGKDLINSKPNEAFTYTIVDHGKKVTKLGTNPVMTVTEANQRAYKLKVYYSSGLLAYQGNVDFYDPNKDPIWYNVSEDDVGFVVSHARTSCSSSSAVEKEGTQSIAQIGGVDYVLSQFVTNIPGRSHVVTAYPLHSDAYYKMFEDDNYNLTFDAYLGYPEKSKLGSFIKATTDVHRFGQANGAWRPGINGVSTSEATGLSDKLTISIPLNDFVKNWAEYMSGNPDGRIHSTSGQDFDFLISNCMEAWRDNPYPTQIYVGNFQLTKNA